jgi:hypothetical protein
LRQCRRSIDMRLAHAEEVEIGAVQDEDAGHRDFPEVV